MTQPVTKVRLDNGLTILLKEIHTASIISQWIWYRVGSRDEIPGLTGASHWTEHMQFKGTTQFPSGVLDKAISREGGVWNAFTYLDWTTYYETLPAERIDLALELEADRMCNSLFDPDEVESERSVIISEREGSENDPLFRLSEELSAAAFRVHPYHHEIIGDMADLDGMQRQDLYRHYRAHYTPDNAVLSMAGDFDTGKMLDRLSNLYRDIPRRDGLRRRIRPEPAQSGERRVVVEGPGETTFLQLAYRALPARQADFFPFSVVDSLLSGPSGLNMFGGGISNKTSRLYCRLVERELAVSVHGGLQATIDPYLYVISITVHPERTAQECIQAVDEEIARLQTELPPPDELTRAVKQARALFAYGSESISNQAFWLGFSEMFADYDWFTTYLERLAAVSPEDVQRIAQDFLRPQRRIVGIYLPTGYMPEGSASL